MNANDKEDVRNLIAKRAEADLQAATWIQDLLNKTEGGGYIVPKAGLLGHPVAWGDHVSRVSLAVKRV